MRSVVSGITTTSPSSSMRAAPMGTSTSRSDGAAEISGVSRTSR